MYVHPNVGGASGGHAAFVADGTVYHVQTESGELFRIVRDGWAHFEYVYGRLQNRPLSIAHVAVDDVARDALVDRFARAYVEQDLDYAERDERALDVAWLEAWRAGRALPALRAAGLLSPARPSDPDARALARRLRERVGEHALAVPEVALDPRDLTSLRETIALREALRALDGAYGVDPDALARLPASFDDPLDPVERAALASLAERLEHAACDLLRSRRPDRGHALLLTTARILAIRRSLAENRLRLLDPFGGRPGPRAARAAPASATARARRLAYLGEVLRRGRAAALTPERLTESTYNLLEEAAGVLERAARTGPAAELLDVSRQQAPVRARSVDVELPGAPSEARLARARAELARAEARLRERWSYEILQRNCITELSDLTAGAFASLAAADAALGGRIPKDERLARIPFVFFARVSERLRVTRVEQVPSYRASSLAELVQRDPRRWVRVRESLAPLSHIYTPWPRDSAFLFFTDDVLWRRPLYGAANLVYGLSHATLGIASLPVDRGVRLRSGMAGALWSLPELAFQNIRKGSFDFVEPGDE